MAYGAPDSLPSTQLELQEACASVLRRADWVLERNKALAPSPKGGLLRADILATHPTTGKHVAVYPRWQATSGTAEEKLPFQLLKFEMARAAKPDCAEAAFFVLEGPGWTWRDFYLAGDLNHYLPAGMASRCVSLAAFAELSDSDSL